MNKWRPSQGYLAGGNRGEFPPKNLKFPPTLKKAKFFGGGEHFPPDQIREFLTKFIKLKVKFCIDSIIK